jgi:hypothetical protein
MHHDYLFIASHLGASTAPLVRALSANSEISVSPSSITYSVPTDIQALRYLCDREKKARIATDVLLFNPSIRTTGLDEMCTFVYFLGDPRCTISALVQENKYSAEKAYDYYSFRLQRLALMTKQTPLSMLLTMETLDDEHAKRLSELLRLKDRLQFSVKDGDLPQPEENEIADKACAVYHRYLPEIQANLEKHNVDTAIAIAG